MSVLFMGHDWFPVCLSWGRELSCQCYSCYDWFLVCLTWGGNYRVSVIHVMIGSWCV